MLRPKATIAAGKAVLTAVGIIEENGVTMVYLVGCKRRSGTTKTTIGLAIIKVGESTVI